MENMIVKNEAKNLKNYLDCTRGVIVILFVASILSGCDFNLGETRSVLQRFDENNYRPILQTIGAIGWLAGLACILRGLYKLKIYGQMRVMMAAQTSFIPALMLLFVGTILLYLPFMTRVSLYSIWGQNDILSREEFDAAGTSSLDTSFWESYFVPISHIMTIIGYVAFLRGWFILSKAGKEGGQANTGKAVMHIIGGLMSINFLGTINVIRNSIA